MQQNIKTTTYNLSFYYMRHARMMFMTTAVLFAFSFLIYMFFTVSSLSSGVVHQQVSRQIKNSESRIAQLEAERIARMKSVDLSFARDRGFIEVSPTRYISENTQTERFSLRTTR
jgi:hypothetical protein